MRWTQSIMSVALSFKAASAFHFSKPSLRLVRPAFLSRSFSFHPSSASAMQATPSSENPLFWNRENFQPRTSGFGGAISQPAKIVALSVPGDANNLALTDGELPEGAELLGVGSTIEEFDLEALREAEANVIFVSAPQAKKPLAELLTALPSIKWVHSRLAGIDFCNSETLANFCSTGKIQMSNSKGVFSSTLAEYTLMACSYFAKDLPRIMRQKEAKKWEQYPILELRGATMGVIGYGDIGRAAARLAKAYGMKIIALRRNPDKAKDDPVADVVYGSDTASLNRLFQESDYILCAAPLTPATNKMIGKEQFDNAKEGAVFINVGRGPVVDEEALADALQDGRLKGAGLDVMAVEPLPQESPLWGLDNVLLSPHNMDMTATFMKESTDFFLQENLPRFLHGEPILNPVDPSVGY
eukprot:Nitzschia sp. Nitz4//scaffold175_size95217//53359//54690//NITZ4_004726-RA/size95217-augustus-gene-0.25-mRNA-1//-1//CDS//3329538948//1527//frame0